MRALGQLRDESLLPYFIELAETEDNSDWVWEDIPVITSIYGVVAIPMLKEALERQKRHFMTGGTIVSCLEKIALADPETKDECVSVLMGQLERAAENDMGVNGFIVSTLAIDLKAEIALPVIEQAFSELQVDESIMGDWDDVQVEFGLKEPDPNRKRSNSLWQRFGGELLDNGLFEQRQEKVNNPPRNQKAKRKQAKKQRKQNRKRKK